MRFSTVFALAAALIPAFVSAQAPPPTGKNITIKVGGPEGLVFTPSNITAAVGDIVNFEFQGKNHSVTQSTFANPCSRMSLNGGLGIDSGFLALGNSTVTPKPVWSIQIVNASAPLWFYCAQQGHCQMGMVASINAVETGPKNFAAYKQLAMASSPNGAAPAPANNGASAPASTGTAESSNAPANKTANGALSRAGVPVAFTFVGVAAALLL